MPIDVTTEPGLDPNSSFFKQLQNLLRLHTAPEPSYKFLPFAIVPRTTSTSSTFDFHHVVDSASSQSKPSLSHAKMAESESGTAPVDLFRALYTPHGKWGWTRGHRIAQEDSCYLSAGAMCSTFFNRGRIADRVFKYICKSWNTNMHWDNAFYSELALYKKQLKPLQGRCVPHIINIFTGPASLNVAMEPPHSSFWIEASADMPLQLKKLCVDAFAEIHARGVLHGDVELRHMLISGDAKVTIIDFQESAALEPNEKVHLRGALPGELRKEMRKVKVKLDYLGAKTYEGERRERSLKRISHNAEERRKANLNSGYEPQLEQEPEEDVADPPVLEKQEWEDWIAAPDAPRLFVVPGQSLDHRKSAYEAFLASLKKSPQVLADRMTGIFDDDEPNGDPSLPQLVQEERREVLPNEPLILSERLNLKTGAELDRIRYKVFEHTNPGMPYILAHNLLWSGSPPPSFSDLEISLLPTQNITIIDKSASLRALPPTQRPIGHMPSPLRGLFNAEFTYEKASALKRPPSTNPHSADNERPMKRVRPDNNAAMPCTLQGFPLICHKSSVQAPRQSSESIEAGSSSRPFPPFPSPSMISEENCAGLGKYEWLPNLRYPSKPNPSDEENQKTWTRVAMENLGQCATQELPHPDLVRLYPHHPRWAEPDVKIFLERLKRAEANSALSAWMHPDTKITGPRHSRSLGTLKRTLEEIRHDLEDSSVEELIKAPKRRCMRSGCENGGGSGKDKISDVAPCPANELAHDVKDVRMVRFAALDCDTEGLPAEKHGAPLVLSVGMSASTKIPHTTELSSLSGALSWMHRPLSFVTRLFSRE
ncbi:hypothetical protein D9757_006362 [Collybiopsis confluens]|uniref:Protein kinase domain-containing protein n=1 Tax=Collybiopsis confluens TaxID=2823264 RepID=A0A8H5M6Z1_9AGAR|nr:hypothetical protein D9757_006362 [Collybiopsis confluens]